MDEKNAMNKIVFARKSANLADLQRGSWSEGIEARVVVEHVVELLPSVYARFAGNLLADTDLLRAHQDEMYVDADGVWHCLLVKAVGARDGILVNAEGASFARYSAYCPDCRPFLREAEQKKKGEGGERSMPSDERTKPDRFFWVSYDFTESGETRRCGFVCEASSIRAAAEAFWGQHPLEGFTLRSVTDGTYEAYWVKERGQFVTVPGPEDNAEGAPGRTLVEDALRHLNRGERVAAQEQVLGQQPVERELQHIRDEIEQAILLLGSPTGSSHEELAGLLDEAQKNVWKLEKMLQLAREGKMVHLGLPDHVLGEVRHTTRRTREHE